jgi:hypothetical protein
VADVRSSRVPGGAAAAAAAGGERKKKREVLPEVGNVVLCRVIRITPRQAVVAILVCGDSVLEAEWQGLIRVQDVRATEKDRVKIYESFRPGDVVRAEVVSSTFFFSFSFLSRLGGRRFKRERVLTRSRSHWVIRRIITCQRRGMSWVWCSR